MTPDEVRAIVEAEIGNDRSRSDPHGVDLKACLVTPWMVSCQNTFPQLEGGRPLNLWMVLEESPDKKDGYLITFDEQNHKFGLAAWSGDIPVFLGYHGGFINTLEGM
jgi:hypothetical protein